MCYAGCRYEFSWGEDSGECSLPSSKKPPMDAMCSINDLEAENAMLRELVRDMFDGMCGRGPDCRGCGHYELHEGQRFVGECEYHRRIRELGIEVRQ